MGICLKSGKQKGRWERTAYEVLYPQVLPQAGEVQQRRVWKWWIWHSIPFKVAVPLDRWKSSCNCTACRVCRPLNPTFSKRPFHAVIQLFILLRGCECGAQSQASIQVLVKNWREVGAVPVGQSQEGHGNGSVLMSTRRRVAGVASGRTAQTRREGRLRYSPSSFLKYLCDRKMNGSLSSA